MPDPNQYRQIYVDAFSAVASANKNAGAGKQIDAIRLTMLSTGIYAGTDPLAIAREAAGLILDAVEAAAQLTDAASLPLTMLINNTTNGNYPNKEKDAFTQAARARNITVTASGFTLDVKTAASAGAANV